MTTACVEKRSETQPTNVERTKPGQVFSPAVDIIELPEELLLLADVPGATAGDVDIRFEQGELTISAKVARRQTENTRFHIREYGVGDYHRVFRIGEAIATERIHAEIRDGVLHLHLPKSEDAKPRKIAVKAG